MEREPDPLEPTAPAEIAEPTAREPSATSEAERRDIHRIGGATIENLRLKPNEITLDLPGISVIKAATPRDAADEIRRGLPKAKRMHQQAKTVGSATIKAIQDAGFDVVPSVRGFAESLPPHPSRGTGGVQRRKSCEVGRRVCKYDGESAMNMKSVKLVDESRTVVATANVEDEGAYYGGTIDLASTPPGLRALFDQFEELVNDQVFSLLDEIQDKIGSHVVKAIFEDGSEAEVTNLQVFPSTGDLSFELVRSPAHAKSA